MNKFLKSALVILSMLVSIVIGGIAVAAVEYILDVIVTPSAFTDFGSMSFAEKATAIDNYLNSHWFAFPSVVIGHATAPFVSVTLLVAFIRLINRGLEVKLKTWYFALLIVCLWIFVDFVMDLVVLPVGPMLASIDAGVSLVLGIIAFVIAGGMRKHEGTERVSTEDGVYRG